MYRNVIWLVLVGCRVSSGPDLGGLQVDDDADGFAATFDCDDLDPTVHPGADERCDLLDNDCDGEIDEPHVTNDRAWFADADGDGHGDPGRRTVACEAPTGTVADGDDCDDRRADVAPGATVPACGAAIDYDCDGTADFVDADGDGHAACDDCDDDDRAVHPDAFERCNGADDDCDDDTDEDAVDALVWYGDADGDGFGSGDGARACEAPDDTVSNALDCDDTPGTGAGIHPGAAERCDDVDRDCDGDATADAVDSATYYVDADGDGFGAAAVLACARPAQTALVGGDCNDDPSAGGASVNPDQTETCDAADRNCDGDGFAGATDAPPWYRDLDRDGFGDVGSSVAACAQPAGYAASSTDCDDLRADAHPGADEVCDGIDNDCVGGVDTSAVDAPTWYADADRDRWGDPDTSVVACDAPTADWVVGMAWDCDDDDDDVHPLAIEVCNGIDDDCDDVIDHDAADATAWRVDRDGDGQGDDRYTVRLCADAAPDGYAAAGGDCDDDDASAFLGAPSACDDADNDCSGSVDFDVDGDGWSAVACGGSDCDDGDADVHPGAVPTCDDIDANCDGLVDADADRDGYSDDACGGSDCDDGDRHTYPGATAVCDDVDHDCDGFVDFDADDDGLSDDACGGSDCNDGNPAVSEDCLGGTGADGPMSLGSGSTVVNVQVAVSGGVPLGGTAVPIAGGGGSFGPGDEVLLFQVQGANAGAWELRTLTAADANTLTVSQPLDHAYSSAGNSRAQVVRVPNYTVLTVPTGATLTSAQWAGSTGGVVAVRAGEVSVAGTISVTGTGYRGGQQSQVSGANWHGWAGESFTLSTQRGNTTQNNGGGGSSYCSCGEAAGAGGYGSPGSAPSGTSCSGQPHGNAGGTYGQADLATMFLGSGGGGGCRDDGSCEYPPGQDGGGLILIATDRLTVTGNVVANGDNVIPNTGTCDDTIGGAGAGGTIWIAADAATVSGAVTATGGAPTTITQSGVTTGTGGVGRIRFDFRTLNGDDRGSSGATAALQAVTTPDAGFSAAPDL